MSCVRALLSTHDLSPAAVLHSQQPLSITSSEKPTVGKDFWLAKMTNLNLQEHSVKPGRWPSVPLQVSCTACLVWEVGHPNHSPGEQFELNELYEHRAKPHMRPSWSCLLLPTNSYFFWGWRTGIAPPALGFRWLLLLTMSFHETWPGPSCSIFMQ